MLLRAGPALLLLVSAACAQHPLERPPVEPMERAIFLREAAKDGWHGISHFDVSSQSIARVVDPAWVDAESRIEIWPNEERLAALAGESAGGARLRLEAFLERPGVDPMPLHLPGYDAIDVREVRSEPRPMADALPTRIELERTIAQLGDRIALRSSLIGEDGALLAPVGEAHFRVEQLGWHSAYHPSVVLARPFERSVEDATFRFTPGIAWLHSYTPRYDEDGFWADLMRATDMSFGPHALLLQFDSAVEVEIGLGVTLGLWDGVLQIGAGVNLMASDGASRQYFYIGSSLIPLAQAVQGGFASAL